MRASRLQHVSVPRPPGEEATARCTHFYCDVLGLEAIPIPRTFGDSDVLWYRCGDDEVHVFVAEGAQETGHSCLILEDAAVMRRSLESGGWRCADAEPIPNRPRFYTYDPFDNQIEVATIEGDYREG
jgi:catechol 2,3-dioxygenase-like lactoylglutathione lyase family enzyme